MDKIVVSGMVLNSFPQGEYDKRIVILTKDRGRITVFARGARKEHSALLGATNSFVYGDFTLYAGRDSYTLVGAEIFNYFPYFTSHLKEAYLGFYFLEFMNHYTRENNDEYDNLKLLYMALLTITKENLSLEHVRTVFRWKYLVINGIYPTKENYSHLKAGTKYALSYLISCNVKKTFDFNLGEQEKEEFVNYIDEYYKKHYSFKSASLELYNNLS